MKNFNQKIILAILVVGQSVFAQAQEVGLPERFRMMDRDGDGRISRAEWKGPVERFEQWDANKDGFLEPKEFPPALRQQSKEEPSVTKQVSPVKSAGMSNLIEGGSVKGPHRRAIGFPGGISKEDLRAAGMDVSGVATVFPDGSKCFGIDHVFGEQWQGPADTLHSGADIPAPLDTPIIAMANGVVIFKSDGMVGGRKSRGTQIVLQHSPADTGLPFWLYTLYSHFNKVPVWEPGQHVKMGEVLGPNGRSGVPGNRREPHLHLTMLISDSASFGMINETVVPEFGRFIDPPAIFRDKPPIDTAELKKLPADQRKVHVAVMYEDGGLSAPSSKVIWPFRCGKR